MLQTPDVDQLEVNKPAITRSIADAKCFSSIDLAASRAAIKAASLQTFAISAPDSVDI